jgi:hypothetical protein
MGKDDGKVTPKLTKARQALVKGQVAEATGAASGVGNAVADATGIASSVGSAAPRRDIAPPWAEKLFAQQLKPKSDSKGDVRWRRDLCADLLLKCYSRDNLTTRRPGPTARLRAVARKYKDEHPGEELPFEIDVLRNALTDIQQGKY